MTAPKTAKKTGSGKPFTKGDDPRRGHGLPGRSGRKPVAFMEECAALAEDEVLEACREKLSERDPDDAGWRWAAEYVSKYSKSAAPQLSKSEVTVPAPVVVKVVYSHE